MTARSPAKLRTRQIADADIPAIVDLLTKGFPRRRHAYWRQALERLSKHSISPDFPKYGYLLEANGNIVGVLLMIFTTTGTGTNRVTWCNVSGWYVEAPFRMYAALLSQKAFHYDSVTYVNISPAEHVQPIIESQGFVRYSQGQFAALPILSRGSAPIATRILDATKCPDVPFEAPERDLLLKHMEYGCIGIWCVTAQNAYPFLFVPRIVRGFIPCTQLIYCRDIDDLVRFARPLGQFLTLQGRPFVLIDSNGPIAGLVGRYFKEVAPKYFKGPNKPRLGDLTYTEAAMFGI